MWKQTLHHIIPTSRWWKLEIYSDNVIALNTKIHKWLHTTFWNATPNEQLIEILNNPSNKLPKQKKEDLYEILWINSYDQIYLPEIIIDIDKFYSESLRTWKLQNRNKIKKFQEQFFKREKTTEDKLLKLFYIARKTLTEDFSKNILDIIN